MTHQLSDERLAQAVDSRALVVVKAQAVAQRFGVQGVAHNRYSNSGEAFGQGHAAGQRVDVGRRGVHGNAGAAIRLA